MSAGFYDLMDLLFWWWPRADEASLAVTRPVLLYGSVDSSVSLTGGSSSFGSLLGSSEGLGSWSGSSGGAPKVVGSTDSTASFGGTL